MSQSYINEHYPKSNRTSSRPFYPYFNKLRSEGENVEAERWHALFKLGHELIGGEESRCCDVYFSDTVNREEAFKKKQCILDNINSFGLHAFLAADAALKKISKTLEQENDDIDIAVLKENMEILWDYRPMLDPRLVHAERIFANIAESSVDNLYSYREGENPKARLAASLTWMADKDNAPKIARVFLYSRLAQHYGEVNEFVPVFTRQVQQDLIQEDELASPFPMYDEYTQIRVFGHPVANRLQDDPYGYYAEVLPQPIALVEKFNAAWKSINYNAEKAAQEHIANPDNLKATAERMVSDHYRLFTGKWAEQKLQELKRDGWDNDRKKARVLALS